MENHEIFLFSFLLILSYNTIKLILKIRDSIREKEKNTAIVPYSANNEQKHQHQQAKYYYNFHIYENRYDKKYSNNSGYKKYNHKEEDIIDAEII